MNRSKKIIAVSAAAATLGLAAVAGPGIASELDSRTAGTNAGEQAFQQDLADRIGVPADKVTSALDAMREDHEADDMAEDLADMVEDRELTQQEADAIAAQIESGDVEAARAALHTIEVEAEAAELVAAGAITRAQADQVIALAQDGVPVSLDDDDDHDRGDHDHDDDHDRRDSRHDD